FGELLRRHRLAARLTQEALAERSGLSTPAIGSLERGARQNPYPATVDLLSEALGLSPPQREEFSAAATGRRPLRDGEGRGGMPGSVPPTPPTRLIGRDRELAMACELLRRPQVRLLTLTGGPGAGKTRLGISVAAALEVDFPDGIFLVPLTSVTTCEQVGH